MKKSSTCFWVCGLLRRMAKLFEKFYAESELLAFKGPFEKNLACLVALSHSHNNDPFIPPPPTPATSSFYYKVGLK